MQVWLVRDVDFADVKDDVVELEGKLHFFLQKGKIVKTVDEVDAVAFL